MQISTFKSTQKWLSQFLSTHKPIAERLLDNLIFINTADMVEDIKYQLKELVSPDDKVAILPIRELREGEYVYHPTDRTISPKLQFSEESLGSEAYISNLYTQLNREQNLVFKMQRVNNNSQWFDVAPSLDYMASEKYTKIFLVDDLVGSGDRVNEYLDHILSNRTIKSWLSGGFINIHVITYMATDFGIENILKKIKNKKGIHFTSLFKAPTLYDVKDNAPLFEICQAYASKTNRSPLGYRDCAVRVVFGHSAPNNIPSILHSSTFSKFKPMITGVTNAQSWRALFHKRVVPVDFLADIKKIHKNKFNIIHCLSLLNSGPLPLTQLCKVLGASAYETNINLVNLIELGWVIKDNDFFVLTDTGKNEIISKRKIVKQLESKADFYYPWHG
ncbi:phosphoribosyltransferase-like protein [Citrobacter freundii]|uniref:phosphoribosyltransferase-like protein n=1 Tax=Citrobacter freundii TaxID=546 RepID=UPI001C7DAC99|nr:hypothetical protein [Citrobacter freundii]